MVHINKPSDPPEVRFVHGGHPQNGQLKWRVAQRQLFSDFRTQNALFLNGNYPFNADYGKREYRAELKKCHGNKCCFCEKPVAIAEIEHFRPKGGWQAASGEPLIRPGYYWLAYSWSNMLLSCRDCNSRAHKGNVFPISQDTIRSIAPSNCKSESKILINPTEEDPSRHISFREDRPHAIDPRGQANIDIFDLKERADLKEIRRDRFSLYKKMKKTTILPVGALNTVDEILEAKIFIGQAQKSKAPFAGMIRENIKNGLL